MHEHVRTCQKSQFHSSFSELHKILLTIIADLNLTFQHIKISFHGDKSANYHLSVCRRLSTKFINSTCYSAVLKYHLTSTSHDLFKKVTDLKAIILVDDNEKKCYFLHSR